ncbi:MDR family MFS transporter [Streptomyces sp. NPDC088354]|uniref:MDR family MFS transporter n=1 Tax=unclassified Streptomyces TaxID=2593676 RepID=UPI0029A791BB|nr:MDR family MFS transporter [Streptomyces sp. MI02-7b]MDX3071347.1 MDR family MFS transporter [Streptomyces sp. MI02-7b]
MARRIPPTTAVAVVFVSALFMAIMDTTIVNVAVPAIGRDFGVPASGLGAINIGYLVSLAVFIPVAGWLGDRYGTRRTFLAALVVFTGASALCATATTMDQLTAYRILQGAGGGLLTPVGQTMLFRAYPPAKRIKAQRALMVPTAVAPAVGPVLGGWLSDAVSWHWVFLVNLPIGAAAVAFGLLFLPDYRVETPGRFDLTGFLLAGGGLSLTLYAFTEGPDQGWGTAGVLVPLVFGIAALLAMVAVERRIAMPMLDLGLFRDRLFRANTIVMFPLSAVFLGTVWLYPLFLQEALGFDALRSGMATFPEALGVMAAAQVAPRLYRRLGPRRLMVGGSAGMGLCVAVMAGFTAGTSEWTLRGVLFVLGYCIGHVMMSAQNAAFATVPAPSTGRAATVFNMQRQLGGAFGTAVIATLLAAVGTTVLSADGTPTANLTAYHAGFVLCAGLALISAVAALFVSDQDALGVERPDAERPARPGAAEAATPASP